MVLETIHSRDDLLRLTQEEQRTLCAEIRQFLVEHVSRTGRPSGVESRDRGDDGRDRDGIRYAA